MPRDKNELKEDFDALVGKKHLTQQDLQTIVEYVVVLHDALKTIVGMLKKNSE